MINLDDVLGLIHQAQREERYDDARVMLVEYLESASNLGDREKQAYGLLAAAENVLYCCPAEDDPFAHRKEAADMAMAIFRELGDQRGTSRAMMILASIEIQPGAKWAEEALGIAEGNGDAEVIVDALRHLSMNSMLGGDKERAQLLLGEAVGHARTAGDDRPLIDALFALSIVLSGSGAEARPICEELLLLARRSEPKRRLVRFLSLAAGLLGDDELGCREKWLEEAMAILRNMEDSSLEAGVLAQLSYVARARGDEAKASELQAMSKAMSDLMPDLSEPTKAIEQGDVSKAFDLFRSIIAKPLGN